MKKLIKYYEPIINLWDLQGRIYKNSPEIKWKNKVHEQIEGYSKYAFLPLGYEWALDHTKTIEKQEKQNNLYDNI